MGLADRHSGFRIGADAKVTSNSTDKFHPQNRLGNCLDHLLAFMNHTDRHFRIGVDTKVTGGQSGDLLSN